MSTMNQASADSAKTSQVDWLPHIDFILDRAPGEVWPLLVHWEKWIKDYAPEHVSGEWDQVGEIKRISRIENGKAVGAFFAEIVRLVPLQRLVYRLLPLENGSFGNVQAMRGYETFNLYDLGGRTLVTYQTVAQLETSLVSQEAFSRQYQREEASARQVWLEGYVPELRRLLAG